MRVVCKNKYCDYNSASKKKSDGSVVADFRANFPRAESTYREIDFGNVISVIRKDFYREIIHRYTHVQIITHNRILREIFLYKQRILLWGGEGVVEKKFFNIINTPKSAARIQVLLGQLKTNKENN